MQKFWQDMMALLRCRQGVAATEFAIALPFVMVLVVGGFELSRYVIVHQKLEKATYTIADVVSQSQSVTVSQLNQTMLAAQEVMRPYDFSPQGVVHITSVSKTGTAAPVVTWRYSGGGDLSETSKIGALNQPASLPAGFSMSDKENIIIAEVFFRYEPFFAGDLLADYLNIYKMTLFKPRLGALTTPPV